jgi:ABC-type Mn2+/Zn2+ transport system permease subunit
MNKQRKFVLIAAAIGIISIFLPWNSVSLFGYSQSQNGLHGIGVLVFFCFAVCVAFSYLGDQNKNLDKNSWLIVLAAGAIALLGTIIFYFNASDSILGNSLVGYGLYISGIAAIGVLASAYIYHSPTDNIKDGLNSIKQNIESKMNVSENKSTATPPPESTQQNAGYNNPSS